MFENSCYEDTENSRKIKRIFCVFEITKKSDV